MVCDPTRASPPLPKKPADFLGRRQAIAFRSGAGKCSIADRSRQTGTGHPRSYSDDLCRVSRFRAFRRGDSRRCAAFDRRRHCALDVNGPKLSAEQTILNCEFRVPPRKRRHAANRERWEMRELLSPCAYFSVFFRIRTALSESAALSNAK